MTEHERVKSTNPFRPTFGARPLVWGGRQAVTSRFEKSLSETPGNPDRAMLLSGSRGIGKTALLTEIEDIAKQHGWISLRLSARGGMTQSLIDSIIPEAIQSLNQEPKRRVTGVSIAGVGSIKSEVTESKITPRLVTRLREVLSLLQGTGVLITIDEIQDADPTDLTEIAVAFQDLVRDDADIAIAMAGLTVGVNKLLDLPGATFLRRARHYELGPLEIPDSRDMLIETARGSVNEFTEDGADTASDFARGYPYLVQLIGFLAWENSTQRITADIVRQVLPEAISMLGTYVHQPSVREVPARQREVLDAMAQLEMEVGPEVPISDIALRLGRPVTAVSDARGKLIDRDLITPAGWGKLEFAQPYLGDYLRNDQRPIRIS